MGAHRPGSRVGPSSRGSTRTGKAELFDCMHMSIFGDQSHPSHAETAARLRMSEGALKFALHRLRRRFQVVMREEIANTVATTEEIDEEIGIYCSL